MDSVFRLIEESGPSTWIRESVSLFAFPGILILHTLGMAMLAGAAVAMSLRALGVARGVPRQAMTRFMPFAWAGLGINALSGVLLVVGYPAKALTNPIFYAKLLLIGAAVIATMRLCQALGALASSEPDKFVTRRRVLAMSVIALWAATITAGRLLPYTYTRLLSAVS
jgi:hypothetical protein